MADPLEPVYLLTGSDQPKIERALRRLRGRFAEGSTERLSAASASGADAVAACNALGLFSEGGHLVIVEEIERWKAQDVEQVAQYLRQPAPETVLALVAGELRKDAAILKACAKAGVVLQYDVRKRDLPKWVAEQFRAAGAEADAAACRVLVELVGDYPNELANEVAKLATWAGGESIVEEEDVQALVAARAEAPPFVLTDAWGRRDVAGVLSACESALERSSRSRELPALVGRIAAHVRRVRACRALDEEGVRPRDAAATLKMHPFAAEKAFEQARRFTAEELDDAIVTLAALDFALKGGSRLAPELELQRALVAITRERA